MKEHRTFCRICISACGMHITVDGDRVTGIRGDPSHPLTHGYLCPKGRALGDTHHSDRRLDGGSIGRGETRRHVSIDECHAHLAETLKGIVDRHGVGSIGVFHGTGAFQDASASWATRRLKKVLGSDQSYSTATIDAIAKTLVAERMAGTPVLVPNIDEENGRLLVFIGINPVVSHGHATMYSNPVQRIRAAKERGPVFVLDPRRTETAALADHHIDLRAGTDYAVLAYVIRELCRRGVNESAIADRATGFAELRAAVEPYDGATASDLTGIELHRLEQLVDAVVTAGRLAILTGTGSTMSVAGNMTEWLAWALLVLTDSMDQPGGMWFNPGLFTRLDRFDILPPAAPTSPSPPSRPDIARCGGEWPASLIPEEIETGRLRALVVVGGNLVTALPDTERVQSALRDIDVLVTIDIQRTATTDLATHVFACADQLERADILALELNANAIYQHYTDAVVEPPTSRPPAWRTLCKIAEGIGLDMLGTGADPDDVTTEMMLARLARGVSLDTMHDHDDILIESKATFGWIQQRLPLGRWDLAPAALVDQLRDVTAPPSLVVVPRRPSKRMNSQHFRDGDRPEVLVHPGDAASAGVADGDLVEVSSTTGRIRLPARVTPAITQGSLSIEHGWPDANVNHLIDHDDLDLLTGMARLSGTAVELRPVAD